MFTSGTAVVSHGQSSVDELEINEVWAVRADGFQGHHGRDGFKLQGCQSSGVTIMIKCTRVRICFG